MSLQLYNQGILFDEREFTEQLDPNGTVTTITDDELVTGHGAEFMVRLGVRRGKNGKIIKGDVSYCLVKNTQYTDGSMAQLIEAGYKFAESIAKLSRGVILNFWVKMGKYRNDVLPGVVNDLEKTFATIGVTNNYNMDLEKDDCRRVSAPEKTVRDSIFIPFVRDDISRADIIKTMRQYLNVAPDAVGPNPLYVLGSIQFKSDDKDDMIIRPFNAINYAHIKDVQRGYSFGLVNNDTATGGSDHVLSQKPGLIVSGSDDLENPNQTAG